MRIIQRIKEGFFWYLDYGYVLRMRFTNILTRGPGKKYRNPGQPAVVIIPGVYEPWHFMRPVAEVLYEHGYDVHFIQKLGHNVGTIEAAARQVDEYISDHTLEFVSIVAHSKGGLIGKFLLKSSAHSATLSRLIAINTPFSGSIYAYAFLLPSIRVFTPTSKVLTALALDTLSNTRVVSIYGRFDPHIPKGSYLEGAENIQLHTYGHFRILSDSRVHEAILKALASPAVPNSQRP